MSIQIDMLRLFLLVVGVGVLAIGPFVVMVLLEHFVYRPKDVLPLPPRHRDEVLTEDSPTQNQPVGEQ